MAFLIQNGTIVTAAEQYTGDILVEGEKIVAIGQGLENRAQETIDAGGKYIFPGGVDGHIHFYEAECLALPSADADASESDAIASAVAGGTTTVVQFAPQPEGLSILDSVHKHHEEKFKGRSAADFGLHAMVMDVKEAIFDELPALVDAGVPSIKLFMAYRGTPFCCDDGTIFRMLQKSRAVGMLTMVHAENADVIEVLQQQLVAAGKTDPKYHAVSRPPAVEAEAIQRTTALAQVAGAPVFIVHISCTEGMQALRSANQRGVAAFGETCPHYLTLDVDELARPDFEGAKYVCSPPLREAWHQDELWRALQQGWIQTVGTDHCGLNFGVHKQPGREDFRKIPNGLPGVESRLALLYTYGVCTGKLSLERMVDVFATAPAKFYGLYPRKGSLTVGGDADIVIYDPDYSGRFSVATSLQGIDYNVHEGMQQLGRADKVFLRGHLMVDGGSFVGRKDQGEFLPRTPYGQAYTGMAG